MGLLKWDWARGIPKCKALCVAITRVVIFVTLAHDERSVCACRPDRFSDFFLFFRFFFYYRPSQSSREKICNCLTVDRTGKQKKINFHISIGDQTRLPMTTDRRIREHTAVDQIRTCIYNKQCVSL